MTIKLNNGQESAVAAVLAGRNVFITGGAGTGKSVALREAVRLLRASGRAVMVCAPTGIAALQVDGSTINRALGFPTHALLNLDGLNPSRALCAADVLVIDEVGMVRSDVMDAVAHVIEVAGRMRYNKYKELVEREKPKRYQVILCGDALQLPPVVTDEDRKNLLIHYADATATSSFFCFQAKGWATIAPEPHILTEIMRQAGDDGFADLLNRVRVADESCIGELNCHVDKERPAKAVYMAHSNRKVDELNREALARIDSKARRYFAHEEGQLERGDRPTDSMLELKVGARVMAVVNEPVDAGGYVNGSLGVVKQLDDDDVVVEFDDVGRKTVGTYEWVVKRYEASKGDDGSTVLREKRVGSFSQLPLKLAWAMTIHKSQGQTFDEVVIDPRTSHPTPGLLYVALSRCRSAAGLHLVSEVTPSLLVADSAAVDFYESLEGPQHEVAVAAPKQSQATGTDNATPRPPEEGQGNENDLDEGAVASPLIEVERELHGILSRESSWTRVFELVRRVEVEELWRDAGCRSFSAWVNSYAEKEGVSTALLWHRRSAGLEWERLADEVEGVPMPGDPDAPTALNEANLNLIRKISKQDGEGARKLAGELAVGKATHKDLVRAWKAAKAPKDSSPSSTSDGLSKTMERVNAKFGRQIVSSLPNGRMVIDFGIDEDLADQVLNSLLVLG